MLRLFKRMKSVCICECGRLRKINQDRAAQFFTETAGLYFVADGMGGHYAGEKASQMVLDRLSNWWQGYLREAQRPGFIQAVEQLRLCIQNCHEEIRSFTPEGKLCGTTLTLLWVDGRRYGIFSVGDSRCYMVSRKGLFSTVVQMTRDDVLSGSGAIGRSGKLNRVLGVGEKCKYSFRSGILTGQTVFILCTDGVYKVCPESTWIHRMKQSLWRNFQTLGEKMAHRVELEGSPDNYSLILIEVP